MRALVLAAVLAVTAACGAYQFPGGNPGPSPATGSVSGRVVAIPCTPIEQQGAPSCAGRGVPKLEIDYVRDGSTAASAVTDGNGNYAVRLPSGTYAVKMKTFMRVISGPLTLTVAGDTSVVANYTLDSGIRAPVPQQ